MPTDRNNTSLLLVEDQRENAELIGAALERQHFHVDYALDGLSGLHLAVTQHYDALLFDLMLPGIDCLDIARKLRGLGRNDVPNLMLTARDTLEDKLIGFEAGADDYLVKPFEMRELVARIRALVRRDRREVSPEVLRVGDLTLDTATSKLTRAGQMLLMRPSPLRLVKILMRQSPRLVSRASLEAEIWGDAVPESDALRVHIYQIRGVVDKPFDRPLVVHTAVSSGYRIADLSRDQGWVMSRCARE